MTMNRQITFTILFAIVVLIVLTYTYYLNNDVQIQVGETGSFTDTRDGRVYKTVKISDQWIMAENFAYKPERGNYWAYNNDSANVNKYGYLYDWETAKNIAPAGWHLPTVSDWKKLKEAMGGKRDVYKYLGGTMEIVYKQMAAGGCGFNAVLSGIRSNNGNFVYLDTRTDFWSASPSESGQYFYTLEGKKDGKKLSIFDSKEGIATLASQQDDSKGGKCVRLFKD